LAFGISESTAKKAREDECDWLTEMIRIPGGKRRRIDIDQETHAKNFFDEVIPVASGRDYRNNPYTDSKLYELYLFFSPFSQKRRRKSLLFKEPITGMSRSVRLRKSIL